MALKKTRKPILKSKKAKGLAPPFSRAELMSKTKAELAGLTKKKKIKVNARLLKAQMVKALLAPAKKKRKAATKKKTAKKTATPPSPKTLARKRGAVKAKAKALKPKTTPSRKKTSLPKTEVDAITKTTPPPPFLPAPPTQSPKVAVLVKDPCWAYCYWDLGTGKAGTASPAKGNAERPVMVLRMWDKTDPRDVIHFDVHVKPRLKGYYVRVDEAREYQFEVGFTAPGGKFLSLAKSGMVRTPRAGMAPRRPAIQIPKAWRCSEEKFTEIYALSHGLDVRLHGGTVRRMMRQGPSVPSPGISSWGELKERGETEEDGVEKKTFNS